MSDSLPDKIVVFGADGLRVGITDHHVSIQLLGLEKEAGMTPGLGVAIALTPSEARQFARLLLKKASSAEDGLSRC